MRLIFSPCFYDAQYKCSSMYLGCVRACEHTRICTVSDDITIDSGDGGLPEQQSVCVCDVNCSQTAGLIQSCKTHKKTHTHTH